MCMFEKVKLVSGWFDEPQTTKVKYEIEEGGVAHHWDGAAWLEKQCQQHAERQQKAQALREKREKKKKQGKEDMIPTQLSLF